MNSNLVNSNLFAVRARWVFPVAGPPIPGGVLTVREGRVAAVGENLSGAPAMDLGDAAIIPGLVNAHTHLEFSELPAPLGRPGMPFPDWIGQVVAWRRQRDESPEEGARRRHKAVEQGLQETIAGGVAMLGEIASPGWLESPLHDMPIGCTVFQELLGLEPERRGPLMELAESHLFSAKVQRKWRPALSPHAPYTTSLELVEDAAELSRREGVPLAMHLAESPEELELLRAGTGPFRELLSGVWPRLSELLPQNLRPLDYLKRLARGARSLVVHGNYLNDEELRFLADRAGTINVVYCPRTHHYFRHRDYPLEKMLKLGVRVALGTDSRASSPDLNFWEELRFVAHRYPGISPATVLQLGTENGAATVGVGNEYGSLVAGHRASITVIDLPQRTANDPHDLLFDDESRVVDVYAQGVRSV